jgi:hypothetical protein
MSALTMTIGGKFQFNTIKQQNVTDSAVVLTALAISDEVKGQPENIFVQALSSNGAAIFLGKSGVTAGGAGIELLPGSSINLPDNKISDWYAISGTTGQKLNIIYSSGVE